MSAMAPAPERPTQEDDGYLGPFSDAPLLLLAGAEEDGAEPEPHIWRSID